MGLSHRMILVDSDDRVVQMRNTHFEALLTPRPRVRVPQFAKRRIRVAEVVVRLEDRRPVEIVRIAYFYLHFDARGCVRYDAFLRHGRLSVEAATGSVFATVDKQAHVVHAGHRFAARRRDHEATWKPTRSIDNAICDAALGSVACTAVEPVR